MSFTRFALLRIVPLAAIIGVLNALASHRHRLLSRDWWLGDLKEMTGVYAVQFLIALIVFVAAKAIVTPHEPPERP